MHKDTVTHYLKRRTMTRRVLSLDAGHYDTSFPGGFM